MRAKSGGVLISTPSIEVNIAASGYTNGVFGFLASDINVIAQEGDMDKATSLTVERVGQLNWAKGNVTVNWAATSTGDTKSLSGSLVFQPTDMSKTIVITVFADDTPDLDEKITVTLMIEGDHAKIRSDRKVSTILIPKNDRPYGDMMLAPRSGGDDISATEISIGTSGRFVSFRVQRVPESGTIGDITVEIEVRYRSAISTAPASPGLISCTEKTENKIEAAVVQDCRLMVIVSAGNTISDDITVYIADTDRLELDGMVNVVITKAAPAAYVAEPLVFFVPMAAADGSLEFNMASRSLDIPEPTVGGTTETKLIVTRVDGLYTPGGTGLLMLPWTISSIPSYPGSGLCASNMRGSRGSECTVNKGILSFGAGNRTQTLSIFMFSDETPELKSTATVQLRDPQYYAPSGDSGPITANIVVDSVYGVAVIQTPASDLPFGLIEFPAGGAFKSYPEDQRTANFIVSRTYGQLNEEQLLARVYVNEESDTFPKFSSFEVPITFAAGASSATLSFSIPTFLLGGNIVQTFTISLTGFANVEDQGETDWTNIQASTPLLGINRHASVAISPKIITSDPDASTSGCRPFIPQLCVGIDNVKAVLARTKVEIQDCLNELDVVFATAGICATGVMKGELVVRGILSWARSSNEDIHNPPVRRRSSDRLLTLGERVLDVIESLLMQSSVTPAITDLISDFTHNLLVDCTASDAPDDGSCACCCSKSIAGNLVFIEAHRTSGRKLSFMDRNLPASVELKGIEGTPSVLLPISLSGASGISATNDQCSHELHYIANTISHNALTEKAEGSSLVGATVAIDFYNDTRTASTLALGGSLDYTIPMDNNVKSPSCVHWRENGWSTGGCTLVSDTGKGISCSCSLVSSTFGVLASNQDPLPNFIYVTCAVVIGTATIILALHYCLNSFKNSKKASVIKNLCFAVIGANGAYIGNMSVISEATTDNSDASVFAAAMFTHYFALTYMFAIMTAILYVYLFNVQQRGQYADALFRRLLLPATWIVPFTIIVIYIPFTLEKADVVSSDVYSDTLGNGRIAFIGNENGLIGAFIVEAGLMAAATLVTLGLILCSGASQAVVVNTLEDAAAAEDVTDFRAVTVVAAWSVLPAVFAIATAASDSNIVEYIFGGSQIVQALLLVWYGYVKYVAFDEAVAEKNKKGLPMGMPWDPTAFEGLGTSSDDTGRPASVFMPSPLPRPDTVQGSRDDTRTGSPTAPILPGQFSSIMGGNINYAPSPAGMRATPAVSSVFRGGSPYSPPPPSMFGRQSSSSALPQGLLPSSSGPTPGRPMSFDEPEFMRGRATAEIDEFDDLIFALNTGGGPPRGPSVEPTLVGLNGASVPVADTHL